MKSISGNLVGLSTDLVQCDSGGGAEAFFGEGTKLTVLGKKSFKKLKKLYSNLLKCIYWGFLVYKSKLFQKKALSGNKMPRKKN